ncbi:AAA family ATPase [Pseudoprevotella muciniphila]|uniref:AAA family ATPase n=1 Tax=Pseudoprevotella muciniphila TaxID=2133944 RepID=A0A5P8E6Y0_9BACT|nr:AAA family ATPase [Pseudoprevotella muciniphila]QFQ12637.1 AAA family ATPase [Pseudoprevotella muciniphila]
MKWNDFDVNKNAYPEYIRIISDWLWFISSRWENIEDKNKFIEQNLQPLITGTFREPKIKDGQIKYPSPALGTFIRNLGFIDDNYNLSPLLTLIATNKLTLSEYALINLSKHRGWSNDTPVVNFLALLCLYLQKNDYCDITIEMLENLSKVEGYSLNRTPSNDSNRNDLLFNYINGTGLFKEVNETGRSRFLTLKEDASPIIDFIADNKDKIEVDTRVSKNDRYIYYGDLTSGIFMLDGIKLPSVWTRYYPNLLNSNSPSYKYMHIESSKYLDDISPIIFYGAPGTGKTRYAQEEIFSKYHSANRIFTTFHQSYTYEEFVEGLKPELDNDSKEVKYYIETGVFYNACERAAILAGYDNLEDCIADSSQNRKIKFKEAQDSHRTMLLCIDEINRGNVAAIFGDLISLIEPSKRLGSGTYEMTVVLPYSKKEFGVPANLFIVGTMNTADRSIQLLDSALRRRFRFEELLPNYKAFDIKDGDAVKVLKRINSRIRSLLNKDIIEAITTKIIPLLEEYFYNDINKVRFVLNEDDTTTTNNAFYVEDKDAKEAFKTYLQSEDIDEEDKSFFTLNRSIANLTSEEECSKYIKHLLGESE